MSDEIRYYSLYKVGPDGKRKQPMMGCGALEKGERIVAVIYKIERRVKDEHEEPVEEMMELKPCEPD